MKKLLVLSMAVLLFPVALSAQVIRTTSGPVGYVPEYTPGTTEAFNQLVNDIFGKSVEKANAEAARKAREEAVKNEAAKKQAYEFCWGIYKTVSKNQDYANTEEGRVGIQKCLKMIEIEKLSRGKSCPLKSMLELLNDGAKMTAESQSQAWSQTGRDLASFFIRQWTSFCKWLCGD